jgi:hypothetical protein
LRGIILANLYHQGEDILSSENQNITTVEVVEPKKRIGIVPIVLLIIFGFVAVDKCLGYLADARSAGGGWISFTNKAGRFTAEFPAKPVELEQQMETAAGKVSYVCHWAGSDGGQKGYTVGYADCPPEVVQPAFADRVLDEGIQGAAAKNSAQITSFTRITSGGCPGRDAVLTGPKSTIWIRTYLVGSRLYVLIHRADDGNWSTPESNRFFDSFHTL